MSRFDAGFFGGGPIWWRPGGYFSKPLLANPTFRKLFLARTKELVEKVYTPEVFFPLIAEVEAKLKPEVPIRARALGEDSGQALERFAADLQCLRDHLVKRREFLLAQEEVRGAGPFDREACR